MSREEGGGVTERGKAGEGGNRGVEKDTERRNIQRREAIRVECTNSEGMATSLKDILELGIDRRLDIIGVEETWLRPTEEPEPSTTYDWWGISEPRSGRTQWHGGVGMWIHKDQG